MKLKQAAVAGIFYLAVSASPAMAVSKCPPPQLVVSPTVYVTVDDDPTIPNCVMFPQSPYPGGICERVVQWVDFGNTRLEDPCAKYFAE